MWSYASGEVASYIYSALYHYGSNSSTARLIYGGMAFKLEVILEDNMITFTIRKGAFDKVCGKVYLAKQQNGTVREFFDM